MTPKIGWVRKNVASASNARDAARKKTTPSTTRPPTTKRMGEGRGWPSVRCVARKRAAAHAPPALIPSALQESDVVLAKALRISVAQSSQRVSEWCDLFALKAGWAHDDPAVALPFPDNPRETP